jgi:hypothetical protein
MAEYQFTTQCFGAITIDVDDNGHGAADVNYNDRKIEFFLADYALYGDKTKVCLEIIDQYVEINEIAKKAILKHFTEDETINYYFECHFDLLEEDQLMEIFGVKTFDEFDIEKAVAQLHDPNLLFEINHNEIDFSVDYKVSEEYSDEIICVKMNEKLEVTGFSHES